MNSFSGSEVQQSINEQCDSDFPLRELTKVIGEARRRKLIRRKERWHFVVEDFDAPNFIVNDDIDAGAHVISLQALMCPDQVISKSVLLHVANGTYVFSTWALRPWPRARSSA